MKAVSLLIFSIICFLYSNGQAFQDGLIVTQSDDTIYCQVPVTTYFDDKVPIKREKNGKKENFPLDQIKYLANSYAVYENIKYKKRKKEINKLMRLQVEGKINLYLETSFRIKKYYKNEHTEGFHSPAIRTYVLKKNGETFLIDDRDFKQVVLPLIADVESLALKVETTQYSFKNIETLIKEYNNLSND